MVTASCDSTSSLESDQPALPSPTPPASQMAADDVEQHTIQNQFCVMPGDFKGQGELGFYVCATGSDGETLLPTARNIKVRDLINRYNRIDVNSVDCHPSSQSFNWVVRVEPHDGNGITTCDRFPWLNPLQTTRTYLVHTSQGGSTSRFLARWNTGRDPGAPDIWGVNIDGRFTELRTSGGDTKFIRSVPPLSEYKSCKFVVNNNYGSLLVADLHDGYDCLTDCQATRMYMSTDKFKQLDTKAGLPQSGSLIRAVVDVTSRGGGSCNATLYDWQYN